MGAFEHGKMEEFFVMISRSKIDARRASHKTSREPTGERAGLMNKEEAEKFAALVREANKENSVVTDLGDLYVNLLRCSRSPDRHYRVQAVESLLAFLDTLGA